MSLRNLGYCHLRHCFSHPSRRLPAPRAYTSFDKEKGSRREGGGGGAMRREDGGGGAMREGGGGGAMNIFDRNAKRQQKNRAAISPDAATYDYLKDEVASHVIDRVCDISRFFPMCLDVGCGRGHIAKVVSDDLIGSLYQCDIAEEAVVI